MTEPITLTTEAGAIDIDRTARTVREIVSERPPTHRLPLKDLREALSALTDPSSREPKPGYTIAHRRLAAYISTKAAERLASVIHPTENPPTLVRYDVNEAMVDKFIENTPQIVSPLAEKNSTARQQIIEDIGGIHDRYELSTEQAVDLFTQALAILTTKVRSRELKLIRSNIRQDAERVYRGYLDIEEDHNLDRYDRRAIEKIAYFISNLEDESPQTLGLDRNRYIEVLFRTYDMMNNLLSNLKGTPVGRRIRDGLEDIWQRRPEFLRRPAKTELPTADDEDEIGKVDELGGGIYKDERVFDRLYHYIEMTTEKLTGLARDSDNPESRIISDALFIRQIAEGQIKFQEDEIKIDPKTLVIVGHDWRYLNRFINPKEEVIRKQNRALDSYCQDLQIYEEEYFPRVRPARVLSDQTIASVLEVQKIIHDGKDAERVDQLRNEFGEFVQGRIYALVGHDKSVNNIQITVGGRLLQTTVPGENGEYSRTYVFDPEQAYDFLLRLSASKNSAIETLTLLEEQYQQGIPEAPNLPVFDPRDIDRLRVKTRWFYLKSSEAGKFVRRFYDDESSLNDRRVSSTRIASIDNGGQIIPDEDNAIRERYILEAFDRNDFPPGRLFVQIHREGSRMIIIAAGRVLKGRNDIYSFRIPLDPQEAEIFLGKIRITEREEDRQKAANTLIEQIEAIKKDLYKEATIEDAMPDFNILRVDVKSRRERKAKRIIRKTRPPGKLRKRHASHVESTLGIKNQDLSEELQPLKAEDTPSDLVGVR